MIDVLFEVPMEPIGKGRPRVPKGGGRPYTPAKTRRWESVCALVAAEHLRGELIDEPVRVDILARFLRP